jgi:NAD(P)-dependent dehydrogenase (short-subunit alcohol dehydrogenase family)
MKTTLITGANRGIGLELTRQYAADGWRVFACSRHPEKSDALKRLAAQYPDLIIIHRLDVSDHAQIDRLSQELKEETIDLLINNAGIYPGSDAGGFGHTQFQEWMQAFQINTMAPLKMAEAFVTSIARSELKTIVTISSKMGSIADNSSGGNYLYRSSKTAVNMVVKSLAIDLKPRGITAVVLNPGWVKTEMGGPNAMISVEQSVSGMCRVVSKLTIADSGKFFDYDGKEIAW